MTADGGMERTGGMERKDGTARNDGTEPEDQRAPDAAKSAKTQREKSDGQHRTGVVPKRAAEDDPRTWGDAESGNDHDAWLKEQKPPHWG